MFNIGGGELLVIFLVALVVLGPTRLPEVARQAGKWMGEFRKISNGFQSEVRQAMNDPVSTVVKKAEIATPATSTATKDAAAADEASADSQLDQDLAAAADEASADSQLDQDPAAADEASAESQTTPVADALDSDANKTGGPDSTPQDPPMYGDR